jgi:hypothetical protein
MSSPVAGQGASPPDDPFAKVHDNADELRQMLKEMKDGEINITDAISRYERQYGRDGVLRLLRDLQKLYFLYKNLLEDVKRIDPMVFITPPRANMPSQDVVASGIRKKYTDIGLLPQDHLPSTSPLDLAKTALDYMKKLGNGVWHVLKIHPRELIYALRLDPGTTITFQITTGTDFAVTFGWERTIDGG